MARNTCEIKCINKDDRLSPFERITQVGGYVDKHWKISTESAIRYIEEEEWAFYVHVERKPVRVIVAVSRFGNKYLKTEADGAEPNNLLSLPECP